MTGIYSNIHQWRNGGGLIVNVDATASNSGALPTGTTHARLIATVDCWVELGGGATASAGTGGFLPANTIEYVPISASTQVSVVRALSNGILYIKPCCG